MDFAMNNLDQLTHMLKSKSIERSWSCQIQHKGGNVANNLLKTVHPIGLTTPPNVLVRADKVIK